MTTTFAAKAGRHFAFAPDPDPVEDILYRMYVIFEEADGRLWSVGTDFMAPDLATAQDFADGLNAQIGLDAETWMALAERAFAARRRFRAQQDDDPPTSSD